MRPTASSETPQQMTKRWLWRIGLLFLLLVLGIIFGFVAWRYNLVVRTNRSLARLQQAGYPVTLAEAGQKYYPEIPSDQNAAVFFERAFALLEGRNDSATPIFPDYQSTNRLAFFSRDNLDAVNEIVISNRACLDFLRQSPSATNCRYPIQLSLGDDILLPHLAKIKGAALLLSLEAFARTRTGDTAGGVEDLNAILRLCHSLDKEPLLISQKVRFSIIYIFEHTLEEMLNTQPFQDAQLSALSTEIQSCRNSNIMEFATDVEYCETLRFFNMSISNLSAAAAIDGTTSNSLPPEFEKTVYETMKTAGYSATDHALLLETMERQLKVVRLPFPQRFDSTKEVSKWVNGQAHYSLFDCEFSISACSIAESLQNDEAKMEARLNIIRTVLAIERYRLANANRLPESLSALVPSMLDNVLLDPFDGKPLRYKKLTKGYMVYSIGPDLKDDGGVASYGIRTDAGTSVAEIRANGASPSNDPRMWMRAIPVAGNSGNGPTNINQWDITFVVEH